MPSEFPVRTIRPCAADRFAVRAPGHAYLKVPFARCADGVARHVTTVASRAEGPFHCLDCGEQLSLRLSRAKRAHFAHRPDSLCTGETALHRYAKELLAREGILTVPELILREEGLTQIVCREGRHKFDTVEIEERLETFQPDAIVQLGGTKLAVEFRVSHAVDEAKRAKVAEEGLSMVEVDLSEVRAGRLEGAELDAAILHTAPRSWIHHRRRAALAKKLAEQVAKKKAERGSRLKWHIERKPHGVVPDDWDDVATASVGAAGLTHLVGLDVQCAHWFAVPAKLWQTIALDIFVIRPSQLYSPGRDLKIAGDWPNERLLSNKMPEWAIRTDLSDYGAKRLAEAGYDKDSFGSATHAIWYYFRTLHLRSEAVRWDSEESHFIVDPDLHGRLHRRVELRRRVIKLLDVAGSANADATYSDWLKHYRIGAVSAAEAIEQGDENCSDLSRRLGDIEAMTWGYGSKITDDLCGLPLETIRARQQKRVDEEDAARQLKLQEAAEARRRSLRQDAPAVLEDDAAAWLERRIKDGDGNMLDWAALSDAALGQAEAWLRQAGRDRKQRKDAAIEIAGYRDALAVAARNAFPDPRKAELFLITGQPRIGGRRPVDYCDSPAALEQLKRMLPKGR